MSEKPRIAKLARSHDASRFDCGHEALNHFIRLHALPGQRASISQTYVAVVGETIVGYHTLVVGNVLYEDAPERLGKGETWRVAVKVIDPRGNEGMRVLQISERY